MSETSDILDGAAQLIANAGAAVYHADGTPYADTDTGIFFKGMPDKPDRCLVLATYTVQGESPAGTTATIGLQVRSRGLANPVTDVDDLADAAKNALQGATGLTWGSVTVAQIRRMTMVPAGMDPLKRWERFDNFYLDVDLPHTPLRPDDTWA